MMKANQEYKIHSTLKFLRHQGYTHHMYENLLPTFYIEHITIDKKIILHILFRLVSELFVFLKLKIFENHHQQ